MTNEKPEMNGREHGRKCKSMWIERFEQTWKDG